MLVRIWNTKPAIAKFDQVLTQAIGGVGGKTLARIRVSGGSIDSGRSFGPRFISRCRCQRNFTMSMASTWDLTGKFIGPRVSLLHRHVAMGHLSYRSSVLQSGSPPTNSATWSYSCSRWGNRGDICHAGLRAAVIRVHVRHTGGHRDYGVVPERHSRVRRELALPFMRKTPWRRYRWLSFPVVSESSTI